MKSEKKDFFDYADDGCEAFKSSVCWVIVIPFIGFFALLGYVIDKFKGKESL